ncbi:potassium-transporting ATPase subunit F [Victivallaceae bacterium BBE-744-WT-12]|uniref:Potassium-transporting ATPase subunit F n=2 Tax=Victivallis TaxID=172900 RepID=A0A848AYL5_9BACT|nr:K(+)-transporting ATPase subunit F [Victivallales bacterium CCUG 44730]MBS5532601.1 potassium-transporting ATPase subunit F [bacterium]MST99213.1 potassium-transporting ATPase subunit F [Victivallis lenta]NMD85766.1 potassium-transporting ATPase subunit F [Victivallis vadensis]PWM77068.1 MAG: potassium-transporting ATPase subunit F [Lentisphaerota bacterium]HBP06398.1 potassium-transporting ATPase subunit F [Lentisphaeria bacterium]
MIYLASAATAFCTVYLCYVLLKPEKF